MLKKVGKRSLKYNDFYRIEYCHSIDLLRILYSKHNFYKSNSTVVNLFFNIFLMIFMKSIKETFGKSWIPWICICI